MVDNRPPTDSMNYRFKITRAMISVVAEILKQSAILMQDIVRETQAFEILYCEDF